MTSRSSYGDNGASRAFWSYVNRKGRRYTRGARTLAQERKVGDRPMASGPSLPVKRKSVRRLAPTDGKKTPIMTEFNT